MATRPTIDISFKQLATTLIQRSERGTAILLLNDSTLAENKVYDWNYTTGDNTLNATVKGSAYTSASTVTVDGVSYSAALKMDTSADIQFESAVDGSLVIITAAADTVTAPTITLDGEEVAVSKNGETKLDLKAGKHTIVKGTTNTYLYYLGVKVLGTDGVITRVYKSVADIDDEDYSEKGLAYIKSCLNYAPYEVVVISGASVKFADFAPAIMAARSTGWIAFAGEEAPQSDLASWIKSQENMGRTYKAVGTEGGKDCKHYVYFDQTCYDRDGNQMKAVDYLPNLLGIIASCNVTKGCTNFLCSDLSNVDEVENIDTAVSEGQLVLTNDIGGVRIVTGINSLTSLNGNTNTEDMQYIETVEAMDLIRDDIRTVFKTTYQGKFRNKYKYQMLFIGAVNQYYSQLANEDILDDEFDNKAEIDVAEQRSAWLGTGKSEAADWDDDKVRRMAFKRSVFIASNIKVLGSMENLKFTVTLE